MARPATGVQDGQSEAFSPAYRRYALFLLVVIYTSNFIDRSIINILIEPIKAEFGVSDTAMGFLTGFSFAIFYATLGIPVAWWADRGNRRNIISLAVGVWSAMTAMCGAAASFWQLALARIGVGIGEAGSGPPSHSMIADMYPKEQRASAMGIYSMGIHIGTLFGFLIGGWVHDFLGWREAFLIVGLPGVLLALLARYTLKEPPREVLPAVEQQQGDIPVKEAFAHLWKSKALRHAIAGCTLVAFIGYGGVAFGPAFLGRSHGMTPLEVASILAPIGGAAGLVGAFFSGRAADYFSRTDARWMGWVVAVAKIGSIPFILIWYLAPEITLPILASYALIVALGATYQASTFAMVQTLSPVRMRAQASAILLFIINIIGLGLGPVAVGALSDLLEPSVGNESVRYALLAVSLLGLWGAWHYYLAGRHYRDELGAQQAAASVPAR